MSRPDVDWQVAAYLAVFEKMLVDLMAWNAAHETTGLDWLTRYRHALGGHMACKRFPVELNAEEQLEWRLHSNQLLDRMFRRAEVLARLQQLQGVGDASR